MTAKEDDLGAIQPLPLPLPQKALRAREDLELQPAKGRIPSRVDITIEDIRRSEEVVHGCFTRWHPEDMWVSIWLDSGYQVNIRRVALEPIISELVQEEVKERLKGKEE